MGMTGRSEASAKNLKNAVQFKTVSRQNVEEDTRRNRRSTLEKNLSCKANGRRSAGRNLPKLGRREEASKANGQTHTTITLYMAEQEHWISTFRGRKQQCGANSMGKNWITALGTRKKKGDLEGSIKDSIEKNHSNPSHNQGKQKRDSRGSDPATSKTG